MNLTPEDSDLLDQQFNLGIQGEFEKACEIARLLNQRNPRHPKVIFNRGIYELMQGRMSAGFDCFDAGRWVGTYGDQPLPTSKSIYRGENLDGKYLLLCSEGGLGDEIINVRFAKEFAQRGAKVTVACDPSLMSVFARIPEIASVVEHRSAPHVYHDYWVPGLSAPSVLRLEYSMLKGDAYLSAHPEYQRKWRPILDEKFKGKKRIGLRFYGGSKFKDDLYRRFPKDDLIKALDGREWINLQKEESDLALDSWEDTLAIISQLDLVITSCTSIAHAAGALGIPTWVVTPIMPYFTWALPGEFTPWYNSIQVYRQTRFASWDDVFLRIKNDLSLRFIDQKSMEDV